MSSLPPMNLGSISIQLHTAEHLTPLLEEPFASHWAQHIHTVRMQTQDVRPEDTTDGTFAYHLLQQQALLHVHRTSQSTHYYSKGYAHFKDPSLPADRKHVCITLSALSLQAPQCPDYHVYIVGKYDPRTQTGFEPSLLSSFKHYYCPLPPDHLLLWMQKNLQHSTDGTTSKIPRLPLHSCRESQRIDPMWMPTLTFINQYCSSHPQWAAMANSFIEQQQLEQLAASVKPKGPAQNRL